MFKTVNRHIIAILFFLLLLGIITPFYARTSVSFKTMISQSIIWGIPTTQSSLSFLNSDPDLILGGYYFYGKKKRSMAYFSARIQELKTVSLPYFWGIDHEGGWVNRFSDFPFTPSQRFLADYNNCATTYLMALEIGRRLTQIGFNLTFSPVLDIMNPQSSLLSRRTFGQDVDRVIRQGLCYSNGLDGAGILATAKHFPGHGLLATDTHYQVAKAAISRATFDIHIAPFKALIDADIPFLMVSHLTIPHLDPHHPSSFSKPVVQDYLKDSLHYKGLIITDDIHMKGAGQGDRSLAKSVKQALLAGSHIVLTSHPYPKLKAAIQTLSDDKDPVFRQRISSNYRAITQFKHHRLISSPITPSADKQLDDLSHMIHTRYIASHVQSIPKVLRSPAGIYSDRLYDRFRIHSQYRHLFFPLSVAIEDPKPGVNWLILNHKSSLKKWLSLNTKHPTLLILAMDPDHIRHLSFSENITPIFWSSLSKPHLQQFLHALLDSSN